MAFKILFINGPNLNLLVKENNHNMDQYHMISLRNYVKKSKELDNKWIVQSNIEGEIVTWIQKSKNNHNETIINAAGFTHTSVAIRDALQIFDKPKIELHISNIYKREEFRKKSLISDVVNGGIFGLGSNGYILAIMAIHKILLDENK